MEEKTITENESLAIIRQMIQTAKEAHSERGEGWLLWGWLLFIASTLSVIFSYAGMMQYVSYVWNGMLIVVFGGFILELIIKPKREEVKTYIQVLLDRISIGFFISLFCLIAASILFNNVAPTDFTFPFGYYYILYGFYMFIHGSALHFRPLIIGACVNWAAGVAMFVVTEFKYDMMISAAAILVGYLIPGYLLRAAHRKRSAA
jgi:hypothetical protein